MTQAYPLQWPAGWLRARADCRQDSRYRFKGGGRGVNAGGMWERPKPVTFDVARKKLLAELDRLGAESAVISTNLPLRNDGSQRLDAARYRIEDPGVAVYFMLKGRQMVMACDRYDGPPANLRSVGLAIEAMRQLERHGGGAMMERAFAGFAAIAPPKAWWDVLEIRRDASREIIEANYRRLAKDRHPDMGGSAYAMAELNRAREEALRSAAA